MSVQTGRKDSTTTVKTPREALIEALLDYSPPLPGPRFPLIYGEADEVADAILAALPEGWALTDDLMPVFREGARQERERLREAITPHVESIENLSDRGAVYEQAARIRRLLAEPQPVAYTNVTRDDWVMTDDG